MTDSLDLLALLAGVFALGAFACTVYLWFKNRRIAAAAEGWRRRLEAASAKLGAVETSLVALTERKVELERDLAQRDDGLRRAGEERAELTARMAALDARLTEERKAADEKLTLLSEARDQMTAQFKALAGQVIREHGEDFRKTADAHLAHLVGPLKDNIGKFETEMRGAREEALRERAALKQQLSMLTEQSTAVSKGAESLAKALRGDVKRQGAWGEAILERLLESSGLEEGREYRTQSVARNDDGRSLRPDVIIALPGGRELAIDSKVSLVAYERAMNAEKETERLAELARHVASLQAHIRTLADKSYADITEGSIDYVIMFVPIEGALAEAIKAENGLTQFALDRQVMIATPTTLMMALRTVKTVWDVERRNRNAELIAARAGRIYDKIVGFTADMEKVGRQIDAARTAHAAALGKLSSGHGNVLSQVEMLKKLGARTTKSLPREMLEEGETDDFPVARIATWEG